MTIKVTIDTPDGKFILEMDESPQVEDYVVIKKGRVTREYEILHRTWVESKRLIGWMDDDPRYSVAHELVCGATRRDDS